jgi:hypothetical protein|tara:strand:+ start:28700 stop:29977 length:1278 start_codon:yes stop_codon:yes gene_type:complete
MVMKPDLSPDGVDWPNVLPTGDVLLIRFREIRRERTGVHALVGILLNGTILGYDTFNIGRREERQRLGNAAYKMIGGPLVKDAISNNDFLHMLDIAALDTPRHWEEERITVVTYDGEADPGPVRFILEPYIIKGGGTIVYAPPKSGKSMVMQCMAIAIACGGHSIWKGQAEIPVLYVNLERSGDSFLRREIALKKCLHINQPTNVHYIHARGMGLGALRRKILNWMRDNPRSGIFLDSISRAQSGGSLSEDETGNRFIDMMNSLNPPWWVAVAHTPRASSNHIFGTIMFDAGMDIGVKLSHEQRENTLGVKLEITDANDIGKFSPQYIAFDFDGPKSAVQSVRIAQETDFPELALSQAVGQVEKVLLAIENSEHGSLTPTEIAKFTGLDVSNIAKVVRGPFFTRLPREGRRGIPYALKATNNESW